MVTKKEAETRYLWELKESIEGLVFWLNALHPDFLDTDSAVKNLLEWKPNLRMFNMKDFKESGYYDKGDENAPFFSEAFLYNLLGKEDARTLLSLLRKALGIRGIGK